MAEQSIIVVPIDWSEQSIIALEQAANVAEKLGSNLHLIYVKDGPGVFSSAATKAYQDELEKEALSKLNETGEKHLASRNIRFTYEVRTGKIYEQINSAAEEVDAEFIIMGTSGSSGLKGRFIGSNALRVVKQSSTPVITIKGKHHNKGCKTIVLPLDLTKETKEKVGKAIEFALSFHSKIVILSVLETNDEYDLNHLRRQMVQVHRYIEDHGVEVTSDMVKREGSVAQTIMDFTQKVDGDLLMIMTQQESDVTDLFIGSQAQEIIHKSEVPVLSIIPKLSDSGISSIFS